MQVLAHISLNFEIPNFVTVYAAQNDRLSRFINAQLLDGATPWARPTGALMTIRYRKPDGTSGWYDTLEDGNPAYTFEDDGSVTIGLAEQALTVPGAVPMELNFYDATGHKLSTLKFCLKVEASVYSDEDIVSTDYYNVLTAKMQEIVEIADSAEEDYQEYLSALSGFVGAPLTAAVEADMLDINRIYVYVGSETGYTYGDWYYWNGREWVSGGVYNSSAISLDDTLTNANKPAQAKASGDIVLVQDTQPTAPVNKLWFPLTDPDEVQVPSYDEYLNLKSSFRQAEYTLSITPEEALSTETDVDLDVTDAGGNVLVRFKDGGVKTKNFDSDKVGEVRTATDEADFNITDDAGNVLARLTDGGIETKDFNSGWITPTLYNGEATNGTVLFDNTTVFPGDTVIYSFTAESGAAGTYIDFRDTQNVRIQYIGRTSRGRSTDYSGQYTIPEGFGRAVVSGTVTIHALSVVRAYVFDAVKAATDTNKDRITGLRYSTENRLANPLYTTREKYNTDNPSAQIDAVNVLYPGVTGEAGYRIPTVCVTNSGTVLVAGTHMTNAGGDYGNFSVDVARKPSGGSWSISEVVPFDSTRQDYGSVLNQEFLVDRNTGRIYLFFGTEKAYVVWWEVTPEDGDFRYVYSDNDGETWSSPVSLKSLWDTDAYDYCIPSCTKGIQLTNGTYVVPCFCKKSLTDYDLSYPLLLIKPSGGDWYFSSVADCGILHMDECAVVEGTTANEIWLYARPNTNFGTGLDRGYNKFVYSIAGDYFRKVECTFDGNRHNCFGIDRITIDGTLIYLMTFTDTNDSARRNITLWASLDGNVWIRVYRIYKPSGNGYSVIDNYNGQIAVAYESSSNIAYQDISALDDLIYDSAVNGIARNVSVQDRMQMLYNALAGID